MDSDAESSSYAGSAASIMSDQEFSVAEVVNQIESAFDPMPLDRALVIETRLSGLINAAVRELEELTMQASDRAGTAKDQAARGKELVKLITADLEWIESHVSNLEAKMRMEHPIEYSKAKEHVRPGAL